MDEILPYISYTLLFPLNIEAVLISILSFLHCLQKLARRCKVIEKADLSPPDREKAKEIFLSKYAAECISSEDSCEEEDLEPGPGPRPRKVRRLAWERTKLYNIKQKLDNYTRENLKPAQRRLTARIVIADNKSQRPKPKGVPSWAAKDQAW